MVFVQGRRYSARIARLVALPRSWNVKESEILTRMSPTPGRARCEHALARPFEHLVLREEIAGARSRRQAFVGIDHELRCVCMFPDLYLTLQHRPLPVRGIDLYGD